MANVTIFCGASTGNRPEYTQATKELGNWLAQHDYDLVYGGGNIGLMGVIAETFLSNQRQVTGVMPHFLYEREIAHESLSELKLVDDMHQRKKMMMDLGDCFIALPGGPGTLEEISEVISWSRVGEHQKPCIFFNIAGYYDKLADFFDYMVTEEFLSQADREKILFTDSTAELADFLANYEANAPRQY